MIRLRSTQADIYKLSVAKTSLGDAKKRKASVLEAHKACEDVLKAAEETTKIIEALNKESAERDTMLQELQRLYKITQQYETPPTIKLFGVRNERLSFWGTARSESE